MIYWEINVAKNGIHFFATHERSIVDEIKLPKVYHTLAEKFTKDEGYEITVTRWEKTGYKVKTQEIF